MAGSVYIDPRVREYDGLEVGGTVQDSVEFSFVVVPLHYPSQIFTVLLG